MFQRSVNFNRWNIDWGLHLLFVLNVSVFRRTGKMYWMVLSFHQPFTPVHLLALHIKKSYYSGISLIRQATVCYTPPLCVTIRPDTYIQTHTPEWPRPQTCRIKKFPLYYNLMDRLYSPTLHICHYIVGALSQLNFLLPTSVRISFHYETQNLTLHMIVGLNRTNLFWSWLWLPAWIFPIFKCNPDV